MLLDNVLHMLYRLQFLSFRFYSLQNLRDQLLTHSVLLFDLLICLLNRRNDLLFLIRYHSSVSLLNLHLAPYLSLSAPGKLLLTQ